MRDFRNAGALLCAALAASLMAAPASGSVFNSFDDYGHALNDGPHCAATSFANSFRYLEKKYPGIYGTKLTGGADTPTATRDGILALEQLDANGNPLSHQTLWESKIAYLQNNAPGATVFAGQQDPGVSTVGWLNRSSIASVNPTLAFLSSELKNGEDVEIGFTGIPTPQPGEKEDNQDPFSHMVVLTGLDDVSMQMQYLDPNNPTELFNGILTSSNGSLFFNWNNGGANPPVDNVRIFQAFAESPVPVPPACWMGLGLLCVLATARLIRRPGTL